MQKFVKYSVVFLLIACAGKGALDKIGGPSWIFDAYSVSKSPKEIASVGISDMSHMGIKLQIEQAKASAISDLRGQIETKVNKIVEDSALGTSNATTTGQKDKAVTTKSDEVQKKFSTVTKNIVEGSVFGARVTDIWQDPNSGVMYVRMVMDSEKVSEVLRSSVTMYQKLGDAGVDQATVKRITDGLLGVNFDHAAFADSTTTAK